MKHRLLHACGFVTAAWLAVGAGPAGADSAGPYYAAPSWDQTLPVSTRFIVLSNFNSAAVLDRETGLVWEKTPSAASGTFYDADHRCLQLTTGGRMGWRMPKSDELFSLLDPTQISSGALGRPAALPLGHPFIGTGGNPSFWVMDQDPPPFNNNVNLFFVAIDAAVLQTGNASYSFPRAWCVRGPGGSPTFSQ